jgi:hypothetical protein
MGGAGPFFIGIGVPLIFRQHSRGGMLYARRPVSKVKRSMGGGGAAGATGGGGGGSRSMGGGAEEQKASVEEGLGGGGDKNRGNFGGTQLDEEAHKASAEGEDALQGWGEVR